MAQRSIGIRQLQQNPAAAVSRAADGEVLVVTDHGRPVARLVLLGSTRAEELVTAAANGAEKPFLRIASISMRPRPPMSASADPDMPAKIRLPKMLTCARPPGMRPTAVSANA